MDFWFGLLDSDTDSQFKETMTNLINYANINGKIDYTNVHFVQNIEAEMINCLEIVTYQLKYLSVMKCMNFVTKIKGNWIN